MSRFLKQILTEGMKINLRSQVIPIAGHYNSQIGLQVHNANPKQRSSSESFLTEVNDVCSLLLLSMKIFSNSCILYITLKCK